MGEKPIMKKLKIFFRKRVYTRPYEISKRGARPLKGEITLHK
jgi:hypothetical protein